MTQQTQLSWSKEREEIHIINISKNLIERLEYVNISPNNIVNIGNTQTTLLLQEKFPGAKIIPALLYAGDSSDVDMVFGVVSLSSEESLQRFPELMAQWKKHLKPGGLVMLGFLDSLVDIFEIGDYLLNVGFQNTVVDKEPLFEDEAEVSSQEVIYVHGWKAKPVSIPVSQVR